MSDGAVFTYAEDAEGRIVHVDDVARGLQCGCHCPCCGEPLQARQGSVREHGFKHHSHERRANLKICYEVIMYKLAEQIVADTKRLKVPSYYRIFPGRELTFVEVKVNSQYEREDKQPDVIATTAEGEEYIIEFVFSSKVQHKGPVDYKNTNCLQIDLSNQTMDTLRTFLTSDPTDDWQWMNNDACFSQIKERYRQAGKNVRVVDEDECEKCELRICIGARLNDSPLTIYNNGKTYRICKPDALQPALEEEKRQRALAEQRRREAEERKRAEDLEAKRLEEEQKREREEQQRLEEEQHRREEAIKRREDAEKRRQLFERQQAREEERLRLEATEVRSERSCFNCAINNEYLNSDGMANCAMYTRLHIPKCVSPDYAQRCRMYRRKVE